MTVNLKVTNPAAAPIRNVWQVAFFVDDATQYVAWTQGDGYEIKPMTVVYRGNNQLAVTDTGFFDFTPLAINPSPVLWIVIVPPAGQGYRLFCSGVQTLSFPAYDPCISG